MRASAPRIGVEVTMVALVLAMMGGALGLIVAVYRASNPPPEPKSAPVVATIPNEPNPEPSPPEPAPPAPVPLPSPEDLTPGRLAEIAAREAEQREAAGSADRKAEALGVATAQELAREKKYREREGLIRRGAARAEALARRAEVAADSLARDRDILARKRDQERNDLEAARLHAKDGVAVLPYKGPNGTWRRPIPIECRGSLATIQPGGPSFDIGSLVGLVNPRTHPMVAAVARILFRTRDLAAPDGTAPEPYILFLVRPDGIRPFYAARGLLEPLRVSYGYELVDADEDIEFPDLNDPSEWGDGPKPRMSWPPRPSAPDLAASAPTGDGTGIGGEGGVPGGSRIGSARPRGGLGGLEADPGNEQDASFAGPRGRNGLLAEGGAPDGRGGSSTPATGGFNGFGDQPEGAQAGGFSDRRGGMASSNRGALSGGLYQGTGGSNPGTVAGSRGGGSAATGRTGGGWDRGGGRGLTDSGGIDAEDLEAILQDASRGREVYTDGRVPILPGQPEAPPSYEPLPDFAGGSPGRGGATDPRRNPTRVMPEGSPGRVAGLLGDHANPPSGSSGSRSLRDAIARNEGLRAPTLSPPSRSFPIAMNDDGSANSAGGSTASSPGIAGTTSPATAASGTSRPVAGTSAGAASAAGSSGKTAGASPGMGSTPAGSSAMGAGVPGGSSGKPGLGIPGASGGGSGAPEGGAGVAWDDSIGLVSKSFEVTVGCGATGVTIHPGGRTIALESLKADDSLFPSAVAQVVKARTDAEPNVGFRNRVRFVVKPGGEATYLKARWQLSRAGTGWPMVLQMANAAPPRLFNGGRP